MRNKGIALRVPLLYPPLDFGNLNRPEAALTCLEAAVELAFTRGCQSSEWPECVTVRPKLARTSDSFSEVWPDVRLLKISPR